MNIVHVETYEDGTHIAVVADDAGNIVGANIYSEESDPKPQVGPVPYPGLLARAWKAVFG